MKYDYYTKQALLDEIERRLSVLEQNHAVAVLNAETGTDGNAALLGGTPTHMVAAGTTPPVGLATDPVEQWQNQANALEDSITKLRNKRDQLRSEVEQENSNEDVVEPKGSRKSS